MSTGGGVDASGFAPYDGNSTGPPPSVQRSDGLVYGLGISVGIMLLITTSLLATYICARRSNTTVNGQSGGAPTTDVEAVVGEATLTSYPKVAYAQAKLEEKGAAAGCCSVCLNDYRDADVVRKLSECGHLFHADCVDPWLRSHRSCPNCRSEPVPTPLAEAVALAGARESQ